MPGPLTREYNGRGVKLATDLPAEIKNAWSYVLPFPYIFMTRRLLLPFK
jgi:hypothetical protein